MTKEGVAYLGLQQGTILASTRRIPGLKCETWGTLRFLPKMYWEFRRKLQIPRLRLDKGEGNRPTVSGPRLAGTGCRTETIFITFGGRGAHDNSGRDDKGRAMVPWGVDAGSKGSSQALRLPPSRRS